MQLIFSNNSVIPNGGIFLAGPTRRDSNYESSWRKIAVNFFEKNDYNGIIYIPEYEPDKTFVSTNENIIKQTNWEWEALDKASVIMFWIPRDLDDMPAFTTNIEFGRYTALSPNKVVLGYPDDARKMRYIELLYYKMCNKKSHDNLEDTIKEAIKIYNDNNLYIKIDLERYKYTDEDFLDFIKTDDCILCGSQRCTADITMLHEVGPCGAFKNYLDSKQQ